MSHYTKTRIFLLYAIVMMLLASCEKPAEEFTYEFTQAYCAQVTVGGVVGISQKCFAIGDQVKGKQTEGSTIAVRIAGPSKVNEKPPSPASFQEFLNVPSEYLKLVAKK